ncbi:MAG TPA: DUF3099 domain-containing protein [Propionicimonas sp.]|nr:DUF3099 domain-containing protein [Propionicimonas sp.]HRA06946.1 DUF3099 domain-containing protein [Propionicimonas sp.]
MSPGNETRPALITSARTRRSLDTDARQARYLWTMAVRVACFLAATMTPLPWNLVLLVAAAVLPAIAVMLANAIDQRTPAQPSEPPTSDRPALPSPDIVDGTVEDDR